LSTSVSSDTLEKVMGSSTEVNIRMKDKNDLLETKDQKTVELQGNIDYISIGLDVASSKIEIHVRYNHFQSFREISRKGWRS
jgi:plasmid maintenance system antidote protein VapI